MSESQKQGLAAAEPRVSKAVYPIWLAEGYFHIKRHGFLWWKQGVTLSGGLSEFYGLRLMIDHAIGTLGGTVSGGEAAAILSDAVDHLESQVDALTSQLENQTITAGRYLLALERIAESGGRAFHDMIRDESTTPFEWVRNISRDAVSWVAALDTDDSEASSPASDSDLFRRPSSTENPGPQDKETPA